MSGEFADRLSMEMKRGGTSIRSLHRELKKSGVPGSSYGSVNAYVAGRTRPRDDWIEAAAEVLGVRKAWLASGEGKITDTEEILAERGRLDEGTKKLRAVSEVLESYIGQALREFWGDEPRLPAEVQRCLRQFLLRYFLVHYQRKATLEDKPADRELPSRVVVDEEKLRPDLEEITDFIRKNLDLPYSPQTLDPAELASAVLAQLSVLYLRYWRDW